MGQLKKTEVYLLGDVNIDGLSESRSLRNGLSHVDHFKLCLNQPESLWVVLGVTTSKCTEHVYRSVQVFLFFPFPASYLWKAQRKTEKKYRKRLQNLSALGIIFTLKEEEKVAPKVFIGGKDVFASILTGFGEILGKITALHRTPKGDLELLPPGLTGHTGPLQCDTPITFLFLRVSSLQNKDGYR